MKIIYFEEKNEIYGRKSKLAKRINPNNAQKMYLRERLPPHQKEILDHALEKNFITTTNNCKMKVFGKDQAGKFNSVTVHSRKAVNDIKKWSCEKNQGTQTFLLGHPKKHLTQRNSSLTENFAHFYSESGNRRTKMRYKFWIAYICNPILRKFDLKAKQ